MKASILTIGDELLIGQVVDTNSAWIAQQLNQVGIRVVEILSVADRAEAILEGLQRACAQSELVLCTGGLGPTKDDITKQVLADFFATELVFHEPTFARISAYFTMRGRPIKDVHREQSYVPAHARVLDNDLGTAPGMWMEKDHTIVVAMPGVPYEMKHIMETGVLPALQQRGLTGQVLHYTISTAGVGETDLAQLITDWENALPEWVKLAYLPAAGQVRMRLSAYDMPRELQTDFDTMVSYLREAVAAHSYATGDQPLELALGQELLKQGKMLGVAESCTGGYIAHRITAHEGASSFFCGGLVPYHNDVKQRHLGVSAATLDQYGAVSEETVREMVKGGLAFFNCDMVIAVSGIAGPGGGTPEKPVGTTWIAVGDQNRTIARKINFSKDRARNIEYDAVIALYLALKFLQGKDLA